MKILKFWLREKYKNVSDMSAWLNIVINYLSGENQKKMGKVY